MMRYIFAVAFVIAACAGEKSSNNRSDSTANPDDGNVENPKPVTPGVPTTTTTAPTASPEAKFLGEKDSGFGVNGVANVAASFTVNIFQAAVDVKQQSDEKILVLGSVQSSSGFGLFRFKKNGVIDSTYGDNGAATLPPNTYPANLVSLLIDSSDRSYVLCNLRDVGGNYHSAVLRFTATGSLDTSFASSGVYQFDTPNGLISYPITMRFTSDAKITFVTTFRESGNQTINNYSKIFRLNANGSLDTSFNGTGKLDVNGAFWQITDFSIDSMDRINVLASEVQTGCGARRILANGTTDNSFANGAALFDLTGSQSYEVCSRLIITSDFQIYISATSGPKIGIIKLKADGALDSTFGTGGKYLDQIHPAYSFVIAMAMNAAEELYFIGGLNGVIKLTKISKVGTVDSGFASNGSATIGMPQAGDRITKAVFSKDGRLLMTGYLNHIFGIMQFK